MSPRLRKRDSTTGVLVEKLKYGENPSMQPAGLYSFGTDDPLALDKFTLVDGDERSLVGLTDVNWLLMVMTHLAAGHQLNFDAVPLYMAAGVKHGNACGVAIGTSAEDVVQQMVGGDKLAIFGGVTMTNFAITNSVAEALMEREEDDPPRLFDGIFAPDFDDGVAETLARYKGKCRMMSNPALAELDIDSLDTAVRRVPVRGGYLLQPNYDFVLNLSKSERYGPPVELQQEEDLVTAWAIGCVSNSNTITLVRRNQLISNGVGQQSRVGAAKLALTRAADAGHDTAGAVAWSDSFFPAPDGPMVLGEAHIRAVFASSGSKRDPDTIEMCERYGVSLLMQPDAAVRGFAKH